MNGLVASQRSTRAASVEIGPLDSDRIFWIRAAINRHGLAEPYPDTSSVRVRRAELLSTKAGKERRQLERRRSMRSAMSGAPM